MATRIFCFVIAIAFLASVVGFSIYLIVQYATEDSEGPKTAEEINAERLAGLDDLGQLSGFEVVDDRVSQRQIQDLQAGQDGQTVEDGDVVTLKIKRALAQSGQVFYDTDELAPDSGTETFGIDRFCPAWPESLLGLQIGGQRRLLLPAAEIADCSLDLQAHQWPGDYDLVMDVELVGIADRTDIGSDKPLPDFEPLTEPLAELRVEDLKEGTGPAATAKSVVIASYTGVLADDGTVFNNAKGLRFDLSAVLPGWRAGVTGMKEGGERRIFIPAEMAYGAQGSQLVPPDVDLVFDVHLIRVLPAEAL